MLYETSKRILDIVSVVVLGIILLPICLLTAIAIKIESKGPIFAETPERVGRRGQPFRLYKFRSMIPNAHQMLRKDPGMRRLYEEYKKGSYKLKKDPRVTKVGVFIRKHSIDEIPQFINVLKGEMSLVGPRPYYFDELREQQKKYPKTKPLVKEVLTAKPGITGYWQVTGRSEINFNRRIAMDAEYVRRRNLLDDIKIILKTPWAMISGKGAV